MDNIKYFHFKFIIGLIFSISLCGCATIFTKKQTIHIGSSPSGAHVFVDNEYIGKTPLSFKTKKVNSEFTISKSGYDLEYIVPQIKCNNLIWLNFLNGYLGFIIDIPYYHKYDITNYYAVLTPKKKQLSSTPLTISAIDTSSESVQSKSSTSKKSTSKKSTSKTEVKIKEMPIAKDILNKIRVQTGKQKYNAKYLYKKYSSAVFTVFTSFEDESAQGSGFFLTSSGIAISNYHVFKDSYKGKELIKLSNGQEFKVKKVLGYSTKYDYIIFQVDGENFNYIPITKRGYSIGDKVYSIGTPRGYDNTLSDGIISQVRSDFIIQTDVNIDHGSSGGVLCNEYGEAIGITTGGIPASVANLNFAIDIRVIFEEVIVGKY